MRRPPAPAVVAALAVVGVLAAGCAIPTQSSPQSIASSKVPFQLLDPHPSTTTTTVPDAASFVSVRVFFLNQSSQLTPEVRYVPPNAPLLSILNALTDGPSSGEVAQGITTALPNDVSVLSATPAGNNVVVVNMNSAFAQIAGNDTELAVGQIVATVANENGLGTGVIFEIEGQRTSVPVASGAQVTGPVYLLEFLQPPAT